MGLRDLFKKPEPEVPANERHLSFDDLKDISRTGQEVWFRYADQGKPQVNAGLVEMYPSGSVDIMVTHYNDEERARTYDRIRAGGVRKEDIFWSKDDLLAANEERMAADFAKAVEGIPEKGSGQEL